ncbi:MAG TPA: hydrogen peroxide-dependent heme synthase [Microbacterium sp.]|nr:hydrogen peroxide-dependent heme synthase [Microbacterium sp.]
MTMTMTNETQSQLGYTLWAVFARPAGASPGPLDTAPLAAAIDALAPAGVALRGIYDVSGLRADADVMLWLIGDDAQQLQAALRSLRRTAPFASLAPRWNVLGVHRDAEFSRSHAPAYMRGLAPKSWVTVYPFVRSLDWYLLPEDERRGMLGEHGRMGREFPQVQSNTVASFALGDYEWILALEADDPIELVDLMRHLRATEARRHVREEIPFFTGRLIELHELEEVLS